MNCPKCGFVQEERADCKKCGVVFAKFFAFHVQESAPTPSIQEPPTGGSAVALEPSPAELSQLHEIKQSLRNLEQRFHELEFERAERRRLHGEMRVVGERLQESLARVTACQEEVELHAAKLAELPAAPSLEEFSALQIEVRTLDIRSLQKCIEQLENRMSAYMLEQSRRGDALSPETLARLEKRLGDLETGLDTLGGAVNKQEQSRRGDALAPETIARLEKRLGDLETGLNKLSGAVDKQAQARRGDTLASETLARLEKRLGDLESGLDRMGKANSAALNDSAHAKLDSTLKGFEDLKASLQNVTLRYTEIGELKKNHLVLHNMIESLQHALEGLKKDPSNGTAGKMADLQKEVSALKAEVRTSYERIELLESHPAKTEFAGSEEFSSLREDLASAVRLHAEERMQTQSRLDALEARVGESIAELATLPGQREAFASQCRIIEQRCQVLAGTQAELSKANQGLPEKTAELHKDVEQLGQEYLQTRTQLRALEERLNSLLKPPTNGNTTPSTGDMQVIRENLDEIRHFMATLTRKL